jgi:hypothetical protein
MTTSAARHRPWINPAMAAGTAVWLLLLVLLLAFPYLSRSATLGDDLIRNTVRLSLLYYAAAISLMLFLGPNDWAGLRGRVARWFWTLAWLAYLIHLAMAFHHFHHWSHAEAVRHVKDVSGAGEGIYASHFFTLIWTADVIFWWLWPARYAARSPWLDGLLHGFMLFVVFNATIIFEEGWIRWAGIVLFVELGVCWCSGGKKKKMEPLQKGFTPHGKP